MDRYPEQIVSFHAVTRYVQQILGVVCDEDPSAQADAENHCAAAGLTVSQVRWLILTPGVRLAIGWGIPQVKTGGMTVYIAQPRGIVTTVSLSLPPPQRRLIILSDRETRRMAHAYSRRQRHRPTVENREDLEP